MYEQIIGGINKQEQNFYFYSILRLSEKLFCIRQADYYFIQVTLRYRSLYHTIIHKGNSLRCGYLNLKKNRSILTGAHTLKANLLVSLPQSPGDQNLWN